VWNELLAVLGFDWGLAMVKRLRVDLIRVFWLPIAKVGTLLVLVSLVLGLDWLWGRLRFHIMDSCVPELS
jgi:hypothetical protein